MPRLFVAIRPPAHVVDALLDLMDEGMEAARWQDDEQLHLTLRFIGDVDLRTADEVACALGDVRAAPFEITLAEIGAFSRRGRVETLWMGATPHEPLLALHRKIDRTVVRCGLSPEGRAFHPHVTLARLGRRSGDCGAWIAANAGLTLPAFDATAFELIESHLERDGARYEIVARFPLRG